MVCSYFSIHTLFSSNWSTSWKTNFDLLRQKQEYYANDWRCFSSILSVLRLLWLVTFPWNGWRLISSYRRYAPPGSAPAWSRHEKSCFVQLSIRVVCWCCQSSLNNLWNLKCSTNVFLPPSSEINISFGYFLVLQLPEKGKSTSIDLDHFITLSSSPPKVE